MRKYKKWVIVLALLCSSLGIYYFSTTNSCMRKAPYYNSFVFVNQPLANSNFEVSQNVSNEAVDKSEYKRFKQTEKAMKEFGKYVPLTKDEPYLIQCTFGEVTYSDGEPIQFTHYVEYRDDIKMDVRKGANWEYDKMLVFAMYYYRISKEPFDYSLQDSGLEEVRTIRLDDGVEALVTRNLVEWKDDRLYYQLFIRNGFYSDTELTFLVNSSRANISTVPEWVNEIK
ncbi:hypothetical protein NCCP2222_12340 [Sporosarcina sp. NCCP-2222]|uniref:hypothetical protein n=1 Tax=Sporosarcina sp. NCCP-2222 TaxID=2935073 RepID=UPI0020814554|nr:hypothetical protein [Sporosarcina sp. NCCP-2222]GKV55287.1 hypothetical protein NCCP2222_12340 [Sporosarcina sp. NCCP-2222]